MRTGVRFVLANCADTAHVVEYNAWYDAYAADCTRPGFLANALRFENPKAAGTDADPTYLALYDIVTPDPASAWPDTANHPTRLRADSRSDYASTAFRSTYALVETIGTPLAGELRTGATVVLTDQGELSDLCKWAQLVLSTSLFSYGFCCELVEGSPSPPYGLLVLETAAQDPLGAYDRALQTVASRPPDHRYAASFQVLSAYPPWDNRAGTG